MKCGLLPGSNRYSDIITEYQFRICVSLNIMKIYKERFVHGIEKEWGKFCAPGVKALCSVEFLIFCNQRNFAVIACYIYDVIHQNAKYSYSTAVGLFNTAVNLILLIIVNKIASKHSDVEFV